MKVISGLSKIRKELDRMIKVGFEPMTPKADFLKSERKFEKRLFVLERELKKIKALVRNK